MVEVKKGRGYVYSIQYHLVWCVKYRHKVLIDEIDVRLKEMLHQIAKDNDLVHHRNLGLISAPANAFRGHGLSLNILTRFGCRGLKAHAYPAGVLACAPINQHFTIINCQPRLMVKSQ